MSNCELCLYDHVSVCIMYISVCVCALCLSARAIRTNITLSSNDVAVCVLCPRIPITLVNVQFRPTQHNPRASIFQSTRLSGEFSLCTMFKKAWVIHIGLTLKNIKYQSLFPFPPSQSPKFAPPIEFVDPAALSPPEGYKDGSGAGGAGGGGPTSGGGAGGKLPGALAGALGGHVFGAQHMQQLQVIQRLQAQRAAMLAARASGTTANGQHPPPPSSSTGAAQSSPANAAAAAGSNAAAGHANQANGQQTVTTAAGSASAAAAAAQQAQQQQLMDAANVCTECAECAECAAKQMNGECWDDMMLGSGEKWVVMAVCVWLYVAAPTNPQFVCVCVCVRHGFAWRHQYISVLMATRVSGICLP